MAEREYGCTVRWWPPHFSARPRLELCWQQSEQCAEQQLRKPRPCLDYYWAGCGGRAGYQDLTNPGIDQSAGKDVSSDKTYLLCCCDQSGPLSLVEILEILCYDWLILTMQTPRSIMQNTKCPHFVPFGVLLWHLGTIIVRVHQSEHGISRDLNQ